MSMDYYATVVYGVLETKDMLLARKVTRQIEQPVCSQKTTHTINKHSPPKFCPHCGSPIVLAMVPEPRVISPVVKYAPPGRDPDNNDTDYDFVMNTWVHGWNGSEDPVLLGLAVHHLDTRQDFGLYSLEEPNFEQKGKVRDYLRSIGIHTEPKMHLLVWCR